MFVVPLVKSKGKPRFIRFFLKNREEIPAHFLDFHLKLFKISQKPNYFRRIVEGIPESLLTGEAFC